MLGELVKAVLERALEGELTAHLGYDKHDAAGNNSGNSRNGRGKGKTVQTRVGPARLSVPRDRAGTFEPVLVPKRAARIAGGLDDMIYYWSSRKWDTPITTGTRLPTRRSVARGHAYSPTPAASWNA